MALQSSSSDDLMIPSFLYSKATHSTKMKELPLSSSSRQNKLNSLGMKDNVIVISDDSSSGDDEALSHHNDNTVCLPNVRLVKELKINDMVLRTHRNRRYLNEVFLGQRACERHQCYKRGGPHRIGMGSSVRLGPFSEDQMDAVMGELVKIYCNKHIKYLDYVSKVLVPEAMTKIYMDVHGASHTHAEEVMRGVKKEYPRSSSLSI
ncbi:uncharacterized protein LOC129283017 [Lytechinus pictus]|uniref:uncharacterized protein LOC129283017 n=1 Tax=Lytechinus pictus TaxID=7653 RepID=UPI0030B9C189